MSPLGNAIANWLKTGPGPTKTPCSTIPDCWQEAYDRSPLKGKVDVESFSAALDRAGYTPQPRMDGEKRDIFVLALPEKQAGSR